MEESPEKPRDWIKEIMEFALNRFLQAKEKEPEDIVDEIIELAFERSHGCWQYLESLKKPDEIDEFDELDETDSIQNLEIAKLTAIARWGSKRGLLDNCNRELETCRDRLIVEFDEQHKDLFMELVRRLCCSICYWIPRYETGEKESFIEYIHVLGALNKAEPERAIVLREMEKDILRRLLHPDDTNLAILDVLSKAEKLLQQLEICVRIRGKYKKGAYSRTTIGRKLKELEEGRGRTCQ